MNYKKNWTDFQRLMQLIAVRFKEDHCAQIAASLTFTTLLSLVPLVTIALTVFSAFPVFSDFSEEIKKFILQNMMPETGGKLISHYVEQFATSAARLTALGIIFLGLTAMLMMLTIDHALNTIWRVSRPRPLIQRVMIYWLVLTLGPLLIGGSLSLTSWLVGISVGYAHQLSQFGVFMLKVLPILLTAPAFTFLFRVVPNRYVPMRHAFTGGVVAAVAFESMNSFFALYIAHMPTYTLVYGAFSTVPIFLLWIYLSWLTILLGALIASTLSHWGSEQEPQLPPVSQLYYALCMLRMMSKGLRSGNVQTLPMFSSKLQVGFDSLELILAKLARANVVSKLAGQGWGLIREPELIQLGELRRLFVFDPSMVAVQPGDGGIGQWLTGIERQCAASSDVSLRELFAEAGALGEVTEPPPEIGEQGSADSPYQAPGETAPGQPEQNLLPPLEQVG
jgi:membrane protein